MAQPRTLLLLGLVLVVLPWLSRADVTIGWANQEEPAEPADGAIPSRAYRILSGLQFWEKHAKKHRKDSTLETKFGSDESIGEKYSALCDTVDYLVGPATYSDTMEVIGALTMKNCTATFASLHMDDVLKAAFEASSLTWFTLVPELPITTTTTLTQSTGPMDVPVVKRLLEHQDHYIWSFLTGENSDPELNKLATFGDALSTALVSRNNSEELAYTVFQNDVFNVSIDNVAESETQVQEFARTMATRRPQVNVLLLTLPPDEEYLVKFIGDVFVPSMRGTFKNNRRPNPDVILLTAPVDYYDLAKADRKLMKYFAALALWDPGYHFKHDKAKWSFGGPADYWKDYKKMFKRRPGNWAALATASALTLDRAQADEGIDKVSFRTFWGRINMTESRQPPVTEWRAVQFIHGDTEAIGPEKAYRKSVSSPGRWKWKSYKLEGSAIAAIVIAVILMLVGLAIFAFAAYKFIGLWLHPPSHSDTDKDDDDKEKEKAD